MSKKNCYFKCKYDGQLFNYPPVTYTSYEKFCKWKSILRKEDTEKDDLFISRNFKLCINHFEKYYINVKNRLTKHAVPTLNLGITLLQEKLLCSFVEENPEIITGSKFSGEMFEKFKNKWKALGSHLNALGSEKSEKCWAAYLDGVISNLKLKEVLWIKNTCGREPDIDNVQNIEDFTELEHQILQVWKKGMVAPETLEHFEYDIREGNESDMEYVTQDGDSDNSRDFETSKDGWTSRVNANSRNNGIVTFTLKVATGGQKPLLQAADITPYAAPQNNLNVKCKCKHSSSGIQFEDEFDAFGKDIARQLRNMPVETALETRELLMSVLQSKQNEMLNNSFLLY